MIYKTSKERIQPGVTHLVPWRCVQWDGAVLLFTAHMCWHMPYAVLHTISVGGKNAFKGTLIWCVRGTQPSVHLSFSQCLQAKV